MRHTTSLTGSGRAVSFLHGSVTALLIAASALGVPRAQAAQTPRTPAATTMIAMQRLEHDFFNARAGLYEVTGIKYGPIASVWPTSQVLMAAIAVARLTGAPADRQRVRRIINSLRFYRAPGGVYHTRTFPSQRYSDDNNWIALDLLNAYDLLHDPTFLPPVKRIFTFLVANWDGRHGGGIRWSDHHTDRPTVSTAPAITIGVRLAAITHQSYYSAWAMRFYRWENTHLRRPDGLYWDHIKPDGSIDTDFVSYNQGVMIDANLELARFTGNSSYLDQACSIALAANAAMPAPLHSRGMYADFDAIYFWSLSHLDAVKPGTATLKAAEGYLQWAWPLASRPRPAGSRTEYDLLEQAAFVMDATLESQL